MSNNFQTLITRQEKLERIQELWTEGLESGISNKTVDEIFDEALKWHCNSEEISYHK